MQSINDSIFALIPGPYDAKKTNCYSDELSVIVETIPGYLARVGINNRGLGDLITINFPKPAYAWPLTEGVGYVFTRAEYIAEAGNFYSKYYTFVDGLEDINFKEVITPKKEDEYGRIFGGLVTWISGLDFEISRCGYVINDRYESPDTHKTLNAADAIYGRIDVFAVDINSEVIVLEGIPAETPLKPTVDIAEALELTYVLIPANATEPAGIVANEIVYDENVEWGVVAGGGTIDPDYILTEPYHGIKCVNVSHVTKNNLVWFNSADPKNVADYESYSMFLKLKAKASSKYSMYVQFRLGSLPVSQELPVTWNATDTVNWQNISLMFSAFVFTSETFDQIRIRFGIVQYPSDHEYIGFYLDYIKLQNGLPQPAILETITLSGDVSGSGIPGGIIPTVLKIVNSNIGTFGSAIKSVTITVDAKGRITAVTEEDIADGSGTDGREVELSTSEAYIVWRYVGDVSWTNLTPIPVDGDDGRGITSVTLISTVGLVKTYRITFTDSTTFDFVVTDGADGGSGSDEFLVHLIFDAAGAITYPCPYALKFTAMKRSQTNAPTLSTALNTDMTEYQVLTVTADAAGLVTLTGTWL